MIPKIIHICWFGRGKYPEKIQQCIESINTYLPDYKMIVWDEDNFDIKQYRFAAEAYELKKYAFVSDVCRVQALKQYGGIYLDTDVEVLKSLDQFLNHQMFFGLESSSLVCTAVIGCEPNHPFLDEVLKYYEGKSFYRYPWFKSVFKKINKTPNTLIFSRLLKCKGLMQLNKEQQLSSNIVIYPTEYFSPIDYKTKEMNCSDNTFAIHHFSETWKS